MLWLTSGIAEWWSLTIDERKQLVEVAVEEARAIAPDTVIQACTSATSAKDCVELTQHARGARRRHLLPPDAADGGARRRRRAALLPVRRRPHRHRARDVQLAVVGLRADAGGDGGDLRRGARGVRGEGGRAGQHMPTLELARAGARARRSGSATSWCTRPGGSRRASSRPRSSGRPATSTRPRTTRWYSEYWRLIWDGRDRRGDARSGRRTRSAPASARAAAGPRTIRAGPSTSRTGARRTSSRPR